MATPLPPIDTDQLACFWKRFLAAGVVEGSTPVPVTVEPFGDSVELADELIGLVVHGPKRATAGALVDYELEGVSPPKPGMISIATDGAGRARAVLRATEVRIGPLTSVDDSFAWDEGEGDRTREWWLSAHQEFFRRYLPTIGVEFDPDVATVFERFEVLFAE
ncbi:MAG: ASCH domain-containing protein [Acidimicrobiales bacterium]